MPAYNHVTLGRGSPVLKPTTIIAATVAIALYAVSFFFNGCGQNPTVTSDDTTEERSAEDRAKLIDVDARPPMLSTSISPEQDVSGTNRIGISDEEQAIFLFQYFGRQIQAVENDLRFFTRVKEEQRPREEPKEFIDYLTQLKTDIERLTLPDSVADMRPSLLSVVDALISLARNIQYKSGETIQAELEQFWIAVRDYNSVSADIYLKHMVWPISESVDESEDVASIEQSYFSDPADYQAVSLVTTLMLERRYHEAATLLEPLLSKYHDQLAEGSVLARFADCHMTFKSPLWEDSEAKERLFHLLDDYTRRKPYSPFNFKLYIQWRTLKQMRYSLSNWADIDNLHYNQVMWGFVEAALQHVKRHPRDNIGQAKASIMLLLEYPIIERFPAKYQGGNSVAIDYAKLSGMFQ